MAARYHRGSQALPGQLGSHCRGEDLTRTEDTTHNPNHQARTDWPGGTSNPNSNNLWPALSQPVCILLVPFCEVPTKFVRSSFSEVPTKFVRSSVNEVPTKYVRSAYEVHTKSRELFVHLHGTILSLHNTYFSTLKQFYQSVYAPNKYN